MTIEPVRKPAGGYILFRAHALLSVWEAHRNEIITLGDLRVWLACHELVARRRAAPECPRVRYTVEELAALVGRRPEHALRSAIGRLERTGFLEWTGERIKFLDRSYAGTSETSTPNRLVPVPRRVIRFLARGTTRSVAATMLGLLLRCVFYRDGLCTNVGMCKASWLAETFGIDERSVKRARASLIEIGWLEGMATLQWRLNRWGGLFRVNLDWCDRPAPPSDLPPPSPVARVHLSPPESDKQPLRAYTHQEPGRTGGSGACAAAVALGEPTLHHLRPEDLVERGRLLALHVQATARGLADPSEAGRLRFVALAMHARRCATRNAPGLLAWLLRERKWGFITQEDEELARRQLLETKRRKSANREAGSGCDAERAGAVLLALLGDGLCTGRLRAVSSQRPLANVYQALADA